MQPVKLIALQRFPYGKKKLCVGDSFTASHSDAKVLIATNLAKYAKEDLAYKRADLRAEEPEISPRTGRPKRAYKRRDMRAES